MLITQDFPRTEPEFHKRFESEEACREYLHQVRWPNGFVCPHCGSTSHWRRADRDETICANAACGKETSLRAGTVLHNSPKPLRSWLLAMFHMSVNKQGISALRLQRLLGLGSYQTALRWLRELRRAMGRELECAAPLGDVVEIDEVSLGGARDGYGSGSTGKAIVVGAVEKLGSGRACGRARLQLIEERTQEVLTGFVARAVRKGSVVLTDGYQSYKHLTNLGFLHDPRVTTFGKGGKKDSQRKLEDGRTKAAVHLPCIHQIFSLLRRVVSGCFQGSITKPHLQGYLDEYCFRFEYRRTLTPLGIFQRLVNRLFDQRPMPYWQSCGRQAPGESTLKRTSEYKRLGMLLAGCAYHG